MGGPGRFVDVSMTDAVFAHNIMPLIAFNNFGKAPTPGRDLLTGGVPCYNVYRTSDDRFMAVGALEPKFWSILCDVLERPEWKRRHWAYGQAVGGADAMALKAELEVIFAQGTLAAWTEKFAGQDCCVTPVLRVEEAVANPLFQTRGMIRKASHPSEGNYQATGSVPKFRA